MGQGGGRRFSPLRLPLGASDSSWRRCSWRCTAVIFVCVTLCLAATTTFLATSHVSGWQTATICEEVVETDSRQQGIGSSPAVSTNHLPPLKQPSSATGNSPSGTHRALIGTPWAPFVRFMSSMSVNVAAPPSYSPSSLPFGAYVSARLRGMKSARVIPAHNALPYPHPTPSPLLPAVYSKQVSSSSSGGAVAAASAIPASASAHGSLQHYYRYLSSQNSLDNVHADSLLLPLLDVYQYPVGTRQQEPRMASSSASPSSVRGKSTEHLGDVITVSSAASSKRVSESTGNKLSALDTRSSGIDLGAGRLEEEEEEEEVVDEEEQKQLLSPTVLLARQLQEKLIPVNQDNGVADNSKEIRRAFATRNPPTPHRNRRRKRSALSPHSHNGRDDDGVSFHDPTSSSSPSSSEVLATSTHSTEALPPIPPSSIPYVSAITPDVLVPEASSGILMNKQVTLETPTAAGGMEEEALHADATHIPQMIITHASYTASSHSPTTTASYHVNKAPTTMVSSASSGVLESSSFQLEGAHGDDDEGKHMKSEAKQDLDVTTIPGGDSISVDHIPHPPTLENLSSSRTGVISEGLNNPSPAEAALTREWEENLPLENDAPVHDYEYQVTPETSQGAFVSPSFRGSPSIATTTTTTPGEGDIASGHTQAIDVLDGDNVSPKEIEEEEISESQMAPMALPLVMSETSTSSSKEGGFFWPTRFNLNFFGGGDETSVTADSLQQKHSLIVDDYPTHIQESTTASTSSLHIDQTRLITPVDIPVHVIGSMNSQDANGGSSVQTTSLPSLSSDKVTGLSTAVTLMSSKQQDSTIETDVFTNPLPHRETKQTLLGADKTSAWSLGEDQTMMNDEHLEGKEDVKDVDIEMRRTEEMQKGKTPPDSFQSDGQDEPGISHKDYPADQRDYGLENEESESGEEIQEHSRKENSFEKHAIPAPEVSALRVQSNDVTLNLSSVIQTDGLSDITSHSKTLEGHREREGEEVPEEIVYGSQQSADGTAHQVNSSALVPDHPTGNIFNDTANEFLTTLPPDSMASQLTPNSIPARDDGSEQYVTATLPPPDVEQIAHPTHRPDPPSSEGYATPPVYSSGEEFYHASEGKLVGLPAEEGQIPVIPVSQEEDEEEEGEAAYKGDGEYGMGAGKEDDILRDQGRKDEMDDHQQASSDDTKYKQSSLSPSFSSHPHYRGEVAGRGVEERGRGGDSYIDGESLSNPDLDAIVLGPSYPGDRRIIPSASHTHLVNENSYVGTRDTFATPVKRESLPHTSEALVMVSQIPEGSLNGVGVNDLTPKDVNKGVLTDEITLFSSNHTTEEGGHPISTPPLSPPQPHPPPEPWGEDSRHLQEGIERPTERQSVQGPFEVPGGSGHSEKEKFDSGGFEEESLERHPPFSRNDPLVEDSRLGSFEPLVGGDDHRYDEHPGGESHVQRGEGYDLEPYDEYGGNGTAGDYESYEEIPDYEEYKGSHEAHEAEEEEEEEEAEEAKVAVTKSYDERIEVDEEIDRQIDTSSSTADKNCRPVTAGDDDDTYIRSSSSSSSSSSESSGSNDLGAPDGNIMLGRESWQSEDPTCKCPCQCDGGGNPPIMPGRVPANLNSRVTGGDLHHPLPFNTTTPGTPPDGVHPHPPPPPSHHHRHRHHHGESTTPPPPPSTTTTSTTTTSTTTTSTTTTPTTTTPPTTTFIERIFIPASNPYQMVYPEGEGPEEDDVIDESYDEEFEEEEDEAWASLLALRPFREPLTFSLVGGISSTLPHQVAPPDGSSFSAIQIGEESTFTLAPYGYWNIHLTLSDATDLRIILKIPRGTTLGLYARRSALPTHTQHDIMRILRGTRPRDVRASPNIVELSVEEVLEAGEWFLSLYNDDGEPHDVNLVISQGPGVGECPQRCNDRGDCILGRCRCRKGYSGVDCSQMQCPILCSGHGDYMGGQCQCYPGYKGKECQLRHHECEVVDCNGHGHCIDGRCQCGHGYTGEFCEKVDCPHPTCSDHGWCNGGTCVCEKGWIGDACSQWDKDALNCQPDCNGHGAFNMETHECVCDHPWTGSDCSKKACSLECGPHGACENDACFCDNGWTGPTCSELLCDPRCSEHGQCKNGTCVCMTGWNGRHCTLSGCPGNCLNRGSCQADLEQTWKCHCHQGWDGPDCSAKLETQCNDNIDNDEDGLKDCQDPECCTDSACVESQLCVSRLTPIEILLKRQPSGATMSFFEKMQFLIEENSLQLFTNSLNFNRRRAAVVSGKVVTTAGTGVVGLRVSTTQQLEGFTLTRKDGMFDMMVNGGGVVTLKFGKTPFRPKQVPVLVPWNEIVVLDDIVMTVSGQPAQDHRDIYDDPFLSSQCPHHDYDLLRPVVIATWQNTFQGKCPDMDAILAESQVVQSSVQIPGTGLYLIYHSSRSNGYESTLRLQLTPDDTISPTLRRVHLRIVLEGILFTRIFEADPGLKYTYAWNRRDVYRQRVFGVSVARVSVGYEHISCPRIIWEEQTAKIAGYDIDISMLGGFNIHVHHAYNVHEGILQKGDGQNIHLSAQRHMVTTLLGTGEQREVNCGSRCTGKADKSALLAPSCLAAAPDGSLYVGDFNLIRRVKPDGTVVTVARLNETRVSYRYHVAVSPVDGNVYVSDPEAHQVLRLRNTDNVIDPLQNTIAVVGSGQRCLPGDNSNCGDGEQAIYARLTYPKGLAISIKGDVYIADGTNIRVVSKSGIINTVIGGHNHRSHWAPVPCNGTINMDQLHLRWPTELAISPLDGSLHILDDHLVLRVTPDSRVQVLTGRSLNCPTPPHEPPDVSRTALLLNPQSIAFSPQGDLYVGESDTQRINRVRVITSDGRITTFAGADSPCNCRDPSCYCFTYDNVSATSAIFSSISSIAVTPDGVLHISDQAGYRVRSVRSLLPQLNARKEYEIYSPDTHEVYVFNRFGKHTYTRNFVTGQSIYSFTYTLTSSTSKLLQVTDAAGNSIQLMRDPSGNVASIVNPQKQRIVVSLNMHGLLERLVPPNGYNITFRYHGNPGLMRSKVEAVGRTYTYEYDGQGRLIQAVLPTGQVIQLNFDLSTQGAKITVLRDGKEMITTRVRGNALTHDSGTFKAVSDIEDDSQLRVIMPWDHEISLEKTAYKVLESKSPTASEMFPALSRQQTHIRDDLVNRYEWNYSPANTFDGEDNLKVSGTLRVNGADLLTLSYDRASSSEALLSVSGQMLINITYDNYGRPTEWMPLAPLVPSNVSYDPWGYITRWIRGNHSEQYEHDSLLRLASVTYADGRTINYDYRDTLTKPERITYPTGRAYGLVYDNVGSLREVVTPRGSAYTLHLTTSLGFYRLILALPVDSIALQLRLDERGRLLAMTLPGRGGTMLYEYNDKGQLSAELYGHGYTDYTYYDTGLLRTAKTKHIHNDIRTEYRYHGGLMKEMRLRYGANSDLHPVKLKLQYDGSARLRRLEGDINSNALKEVYIHFDNQTGVLQLISDLRIIRNNILETMLQNPQKQFVNTRKRDSYGRLTKVDMMLGDRPVYMMQLKYDNRNRISERLIEVAGRREGLNITYNADGQIEAAVGTHSWEYSYDENVNIVNHQDKGPVESLAYDECDRVVVVETIPVSYDERGFVVKFDNQNFEYNTRGQLVKAWDSGDSWSFTLGYDHFGRVSVYRDNHKNATQIIYGRPDLPDLITHLHNPHSGNTMTLLYDDLNYLIAVDQNDGRYFIATDQNGTPIAIFDDMGSLIRSQVWSPFGHLVDYAGANMWVGVGPWGGFLEPLTGIVIIKGHAYHPRLLQWMAPRWDHLTKSTKEVTDVFVYRFMNNDPFNGPSGLKKKYYSKVTEWLELYGIELDRVLGSEYHENTMVKPRPFMSVENLGASEVISGLCCQFKAGVNHLHDLSFYSQSHIRKPAGTWNSVPISRQASIFGSGILVSNINGRALVTAIGEDNYVIGDVIRTVLNNSLILDVSATHGPVDTFYFIKDTPAQVVEDKKQLERVSGVFNVTGTNTEYGHEIEISKPTVVLVIMYGERVTRARKRVLKELEERAEAVAWEREKSLIQSSRPGTHAWTSLESNQLMREGRVPGYVASHIHSPSRYPILASDASNIVFKHKTARKRRGSRRKSRKKSWRQRKKGSRAKTIT